MSAKPHFIEISESEAAKFRENIGAPMVYPSAGRFWVDAGEMKAYRDLCSQYSGGADGG